VNSRFQVRAITSVSELRSVENDWRELWRHCRDLTIFQSPHWLLPWVEAFSPHRLWVLEARRGSSLAGLAPLFIYGNEAQGWVAHFLYSAMDGKRLTIYGDGYQVRDVLCVEDLINAFEAVRSNASSTPGEVYNVGGGPGNSVGRSYCHNRHATWSPM